MRERTKRMFRRAYRLINISDINRLLQRYVSAENHREKGRVVKVLRARL